MAKRIYPPKGDIGCTDEVSSGAMSCGVAQAEIYFRPRTSYNGEFGFDWMRIGDWDWGRSLHAADNFLANKYDDNNMLAGGNGIAATATETAGQIAYRKLEDEYTKLPINGKAEDYHFHWLSIFPKKLADTFNAEATSKGLHASARLEFSATLDILIKIKDVADKPERIIFINGDAKNLDVVTSTGEVTDFNKGTALPTISCASVTTNAKQMFETITVTCKGELKHDTPIIAYAVKGDSATLAGVLMVCKNHSTQVCKRQNVLVPLVKTNLDGASLRDGNRVFNQGGHDHEKLIYQTLHHYLFYGEMQTDRTVIDLRNDIRFRLPASLTGPDATDPDAGIYCDATGIMPSGTDWDGIHYLYSLLPSNYTSNWDIVLFTFNETWSGSFGSSGYSYLFTKIAINFAEISATNHPGIGPHPGFVTTPAHEMGHSLGLEHTFDEPDAPYIFTTESDTDNVMSYSDRVPAMTWRWQWKIVNKAL